MTGLRFVRGGYHRIGRAVGARRRRLHRAAARALGVRGHRVWATATCSARPATWSATSATAASCACVDGVPEPTGADGCPPGTVVLATAPAQPFTRANAARPVADDELSEVEFHAWRVLGAHDDAPRPSGRARRSGAGRARRRRRPRHRRRHRLHRLGLGPRRPRPRRRADHPQPAGPPDELTPPGAANGAFVSRFDRAGAGQAATRTGIARRRAAGNRRVVRLVESVEDVGGEVGAIHPSIRNTLPTLCSVRNVRMAR